MDVRTADADARLAEVAATQHGCCSVRQALEAGLTHSNLRSRVRTGHLVRAAHGVYSFPDRDPTSWHHRLWVAYLHSGCRACCSHRTATKFGGLQGIEGEPVDLIVPRSAGRALEGTTRHRTDHLDPIDIRIVDGLPMTSPARSLFDLASVETFPHVAAIATTALKDQVLRPVDLFDILDRAGGPGRPGTRALTALAERHGRGAPMARSELAAMMDAAIDAAGLPEPVREYPLPTTIDMRGFVDYCWPDIKWIVEADGRRWHDHQAQSSKDLLRDNEASRCGYATNRFHWTGLRHSFDDEVATLRDIYAERVRLFAA